MKAVVVIGATATHNAVATSPVGEAIPALPNSQG
jgi:CO/xanthine dehydrogenase FAD-binding subunit